MSAQKKDRIIINFIPIVFAMITSVTTLFIRINDSVMENWDSILNSLLGIWGTLFGFMIAAVSVLLTFNDGKFITFLKSSGHYKTILLTYMYCCIHLFVALVVAKLFVLYQASGKLAYAITAGLSLDIIIIVGICLIFLYVVVKKVE